MPRQLDTGTKSGQTPILQDDPFRAREKKQSGKLQDLQTSELPEIRRHPETAQDAPVGIFIKNRDSAIGSFMRSQIKGNPHITPQRLPNCRCKPLGKPVRGFILTQARFMTHHQQPGIVDWLAVHARGRHPGRANGRQHPISLGG